ncbi:MAG TPA: type II secretion system protein [Opitutaceae bacterium]|nr:type II secretion system protein [Opitutaceae bacterium]
MFPTRNCSRAAAARHRGFSLVEMMVAVSIAAFVIAAMISSYVYMGRNLIRYSNQQDIETEIRRTLQMMAADVHAATDVSSFASSQFTLTMPYVHSDNSVTTYSVTYTYDSGALTITRTVSGTAPPNVTTAALTMLTKVTPTGSMFEARDRVDHLTTTTINIKKITLASFNVTTGSANANTQLIRTGASTRFILRSKHLTLQQNGTSYQ